MGNKNAFFKGFILMTSETFTELFRFMKSMKMYPGVIFYAGYPVKVSKINKSDYIISPNGRKTKICF